MARQEDYAVSDHHTFRPVTSGYHRQPCIVCGGITQGSILVGAEDFGDAFACDDCVAAGADAWPARIAEHASFVERKAAYLWELADDTWTAPTLPDLLAARAAHELEAATPGELAA